MPTSLRLLLPLALSFAVNAALAASTSSSPRFATPKELRACMDTEEHLKKQLKLLEQQQAANHAALKRLQDENEVLVTEQAQLNLADPAQVNRFNQKVTTVNGEVGATTMQAEQLVQQEKKYNADMLAYNRKCGGLVFRVSDRNAILRERAAQSK